MIDPAASAASQPLATKSLAAQLRGHYPGRRPGGLDTCASSMPISVSETKISPARA